MRPAAHLRGTWSGIGMDVRVAVGPLELTVDVRTEHQRVALLGPSGAGKSTLVRILAGVEARGAGRVDVDGVVWQSVERGIVVPPWSRRVGWVPQEVLLFPHLTVHQNLAYSGASEEDVRSMSDALSVGGLLDRRPGRLSGGERQRVALGRALLSRPKLLLLDEPFTALDRGLRDEVIGFVDTWARRHEVPLVLVSHDERDARALADEHWLLEAGSLRQLPD